MADCKYVETISGDQCIGDSLQTINDNFASLEKGICDVAFTPIDINIEAGDGLGVEKSQPGVNEVNLALTLTNSLQYIPPDMMGVSQGVGGGSVITKTAGKQIGETYRTVITIGTQSGTTIPTFTIETVALGTIPPALTLYWMSSANIPITVYNTNSNYLSPTVRDPQAFGDVYINHEVKTMLMWEEGTLCIGGSFWYAGEKGSRGTGEPVAYRSPSFGFATLKLKEDGNNTTSSTASADKFGHYARLSSISSLTDGTTKNILNGLWSSTNRGWPGFYVYYHPIRWNLGRVAKLKKMTNNSNNYLIVGGGFIGGGATGLKSGTQGLVIFNITNPAQEPKEFRLNGWVYDILTHNNYVYVCGNFTKGSPQGANADILLPCIFRINMNNIDGPVTSWIDTVFVENFKRTLDGGVYGGYSYPGYASSEFIFTLAIDPTEKYLYCGGRHYKDVVQNKVKYRKNFGLTVHEIGTDARAGTYVDWECEFNLYLWDKTLGYTNYIKKIYIETTTSSGKSLESVMYVGGGGFSTVTTNKTRISNILKYQKGKVTANKRGLVAFSLQTFNGGELYESTPQDPALIKDYQVDVGPAPRGYYQTVWDILTTASDSEAPLYISGNFSQVNGTNRNNIVAVKKPQAQEIGTFAELFSWSPTTNGVVTQMLAVSSDSVVNEGITYRKESLLICGNFTSVLGKTKYRLARISTVGNEQVTNGPEVFLWQVAGESMDIGSNFAVNRDHTLVHVTTAVPQNTLAKTTFPPFTYGFETANRGDLCRIVVTRPSATSELVLSADALDGSAVINYSETYKGNVVLLGACLDWNTQLIELSSLDTSSIKITIPETIPIGNV